MTKLEAKQIEQEAIRNATADLYIKKAERVYSEALSKGMNKQMDIIINKLNEPMGFLDLKCFFVKKGYTEEEAYNWTFGFMDLFEKKGLIK